MDLAGTLKLGDHELVSFVGAGGKKTAMVRLADAATVRGLPVGYTTTTHMPPPDYPLVVADDSGLWDELAGTDSPVAFARERVENPERAVQKVRGHDPAIIDALFDRGPMDWVLVKADGARRREFKAPNPDEPVVPETSTHVVPVASVSAVGEPLDEATVHRPDRIGALTGLDRGEEITPVAVGTVLAHDDGGCKDLPADATVTPLINKADTPAQQETARAVLDAALSRTDRFTRGLVCSFETGALGAVER
ncbi:selenium cofactor biosynthesis protein YqeC [Salinibaculum salinum]|uniref:selenium cofactor biosynthesis protein YqeC n=1 Tax=Salinibaculum salinum TaxID=3131996 RepID=UPI0030ECCCCD